MRADLTKDQFTEAPVLRLSTLPAPDIIPEEGVMHRLNLATYATIDDFINTYRDYYNIPGVSLALVKGGEVVYHNTYGVSNTYTGEMVDDRTLFEAASITKPVFGYAVCRLAERGEIDLDKPLYEYLPFEEIAHDDRYKLITGRHVLTHQTGFPNWRWMNEDGKMDIRFTPGTDFHYSGEGFEYLKRVVAHIMDQDIQEILDEEVIAPLQLENTYFQQNDYLAEVVSHGHYDGKPTQAVLPERPGMAWSMHTEARSFAAFMMGLQNGTGLSKEMHKELFDKHVSVPETDAYEQRWQQYLGLGIFLEDTPYGLAYAHGGNNGDFQCMFKMFKDLDMGYAIFTNGNMGDRLTADIEKFLVTGQQTKVESADMEED